MEPKLQSNHGDDDQSGELEKSQEEGLSDSNSNHKAQTGQMQNGIESNGVADDDHQVVKSDGYGTDQSSNGDENYKRDLEELLSKLNPMAQEFTPLSFANNNNNNNRGFALPGGFCYTNNLLQHTNGNEFMGKRVRWIFWLRP